MQAVLAASNLFFLNIHKLSVCYPYWDLVELKSSLLPYQVKGPLCYKQGQSHACSSILPPLSVTDFGSKTSNNSL
jgi:hypothetical protein